MLQFYSMPQALIVALSMGSACCVIIQTVSLVFNLGRHRVQYVQRVENLFEAAILLQTLFMSLLMAQVQSSIQDDLIIPSGYHTGRLIVFALVLSLAVAASYGRRLWWPMLSVLFAALTLPIVEQLAGPYSPLLYAIALCYFLLRSIHICVLRWREQKSSISALSIKEAIDALSTGILFCGQDGHIVLINRRMQELMTLLTGASSRNGKEFFARLTKRQLRSGYEADELDGRMVIRVPDGAVWMFTDTILPIAGKDYHQITAADVSEEWMATLQLRRQTTELDRRSAELKQTIANLQAIYREEEALRAKSRIHDILGQRIALLIRSLRENDRPDETLLNAFSEDLPLNLMELASDTEPRREIEAMTEMFAGIGVKVQVQGALPESRALSEVFVDVITEGVTNAVRHGFASEVDIVCEHKDSVWSLQVTNSGVPPAGRITEGSGLASIRRRLMGVGGRLHIETMPRFKLTAYLPEGVSK